MKFYVTFGQRYAHEQHPYHGHPNGWAEVQASSRSEALVKVTSRYGTKWANMYDENDFEGLRLYPKGCIETIV